MDENDKELLNYIIEEVYTNYRTKESIAIISTDIGVFEGMAVLHKDDEDVYSKFTGGDIALDRAVIKYLKELIKHKTESMFRCHTYNTPGSIMRKARRRVSDEKFYELKEERRALIKIKNEMENAMIITAVEKGNIVREQREKNIAMRTKREKFKEKVQELRDKIQNKQEDK